MSPRATGASETTDRTTASSRISVAFDRAAAASPENWSAIFDELGLAMAERALVERMLKQDASALASADARVRETVRAEPLPAIPGLEALARLGEGAHGVVYLARSVGIAPRLVAVKILRGEHDSRSALRRFDAERTALAELDHPAIVPIGDAGMTEDGRPYFSMPVIHGEPLTEACAQAELAVRAKIEVFLQVLAGVAHAHHRGILHRDLKPGNILAEPVEGGWRVRIIDWGLARALDLGSPGPAELRSEGGQGPIGTPEFMSPEQAEGGAARGDIRSDIWSLGAILYVLLADALPYPRERIRGLSPVLLARALREERPTLPSRAARLARDAAALRGDLDAIVMKALEPDPARRYQSVDAFAEDLRASLAGRAIVARGEGPVRQVARLARRHKAVAGAVAVCVVALVVALVVSQRAGARAREALMHAQSTATFLENLLGNIEPLASKGYDRALLVDVLRTAEDDLGRIDAVDPIGAGRIRTTIARTYEGLGFRRDAERVQREGVALLETYVPDSDQILRELLFQFAGTLGRERKDAEFMEVAARVLRTGEASDDNGLPTDEKSCRLVAIGLGAFIVPTPDRTLRVLNSATAPDRDFYSEGLEVLRHIERVFGAESQVAFEARLGYYRRKADVGPPDEVIAALRADYERLARKSKDGVDRARVAGLLAFAMGFKPGMERELVDFAASEVAAAEPVLGSSHPVIINMRFNRATKLVEIGRVKEAIPEALEAARRLHRTRDPDGVMPAWVRMTMGHWLIAERDLDSAEALRDDYLAQCAAIGAQPLAKAELDSLVERIRAALARSP
jgi:hypothetical protein